MAILLYNNFKSNLKGTLINGGDNNSYIAMFNTGSIL